MANADKKSSNSLTAWRAHFDQHLRAEKRASVYTQRNYASTLSRFEGFLRSHLGTEPALKHIEALETKDFRGYLAMRRNEGLKPPSLKLELSALKSFYRFLQKRAGIENDAISVMRGPKAKERLPRPVSAPDADKLIAAAASVKTTMQKKNWEQARDAALFTLLYGAGLRISEALTLKQSDAPLGEALRITGKGSKMRLAPIIPAARDAVEAYLKICPYGTDADDPLFFSSRGKPLSARQAQRTMQANCAALLGLPDSATPTLCVTHSRRTCLRAAATCAPFRNCSVILRWRRPSVTPRSIPKACWMFTTRRIRALKDCASPHRL